MMRENSWFATQRLAEGIFLIAEPMHVNSYLIVGSERAILFDTGLGIRSIRSEVEKITNRPVLAVNSHHHFDHVGGNHEFEEIGVHTSAEELVTLPQPAEWIPSYLRFIDGVQREYANFRRMDQAGFQVLGPEMQMRPFPEDFDPEAWTTQPTTASQLLGDGDEIDLGGRTIRVLHTPGHTVDSVCLLDEHARTLFSGDTVDTGPIYAHLATSSLDQYVHTTRKLASDVGPLVDSIFSAHGARYRSYPDMLSRVADAFEEIQGTAPAFFDSEDCFQSKVKEVLFNDFSIVVSDELASNLCDASGCSAVAN